MGTGWGTRPDWTVLPGLKILSLAAIKKASQRIGNIEFHSITGSSSTEIESATSAIIEGGETLAGRMVVPVVAGATGLDVVANAGCRTLGRQASGQMTPYLPGLR